MIEAQKDVEEHAKRDKSETPKEKYNRMWNETEEMFRPPKVYLDDIDPRIYRQ